MFSRFSDLSHEVHGYLIENAPPNLGSDYSHKHNAAVHGNLAYAGYVNLLVHREVLRSQAELDEGAITLNERNNYHNNTYISPQLD